MNYRSNALASAGGIALIMGSKWAPVLDAPGEGGGAGAGDEAAKAAAAAAKVAADKAAADKAAAEANAGRPAVSDEVAALVKEQMRTKEKLKAAEDRAAAAEAKSKEYEGIDPVKARELATAAAKAEEDRLKAAGDFEALKKNMATQHATELEVERKKIAEADARTAAAQQRIADLTIGRSFRDSTFIKDDVLYTPAKMEKLFGDHFAYEDDQVVAYDKPVSRKTKQKLVGSDGNPLPFEMAIKRLVEADGEKDSILKGKLAPGARSTTDAGGGSRSSRDLNEGKGRGASRIADALKAMNGGK